MNTYLFKTGRGGKFFNAGFRTCEGVNNSFNPEDYGINIWYRFENLEETAEFAGLTLEEMIELFEKKGYSLSEIAENREILNKALDELKLKNIYGGNIEADDFGDVVLTDDAGDVLCTLEEFNSESGVLDIDGDYNKYEWKPANEIDEDDFEIMIRDLSFDEYIDDLQYFLDKDLAKFIFDNQNAFTLRSDRYPFTKFKLDVSDVYNISLKDFINSSLIENEEGEIIIDNKHYDVY